MVGYSFRTSFDSQDNCELLIKEAKDMDIDKKEFYEIVADELHKEIEEAEELKEFVDKNIVYVKSRFTKLYNGTGFKAKAIMKLKVDTPLKVVGQERNILNVELSDGTEGWIPEQWTSPTKVGKLSKRLSKRKVKRNADGSSKPSYSTGARG